MAQWRCLWEKEGGTVDAFRCSAATRVASTLTTSRHFRHWVLRWGLEFSAEWLFGAHPEDRHSLAPSCCCYCCCYRCCCIVSITVLNRLLIWYDVIWYYIWHDTVGDGLLVTDFSTAGWWLLCCWCAGTYFDWQPGRFYGPSGSAQQGLYNIINTIMCLNAIK